MAIGGMIGGGIFSVLGVTIELAGHLAFLSFMIAGAIALITASSFAGLTRRAGRSGGPFTYLSEAGHPQLGAITSWFLILGYVIALGVYAFTFGHYVSGLFGIGELAARVASIAVLGFFWVLNTRGIGASSISEDLIVATKLLVLTLIAGIGLFAWSSERLTPLADMGYAGVFIGAASIFVAYEGFELLPYDYDDIEDADRTLPRALYLSVLVVIAVYVVVTLGSQMLVPDSVIVAQRESAFAAVGEAALGNAGRWLATGAAVLATSSAINATLFSTARLARDLSNSRELPALLGHTTRGLPATAMWTLAVLGALAAMVPDINELLTFGSVTFLVVFGLVNHLHARTADEWTGKLLGHLGSAGCTGAIVVVILQLSTHDLASLLPIAACLVLLGVLRLAFVWTRART